MNIVVCDDNEMFLKHLSGILQKEFARKGCCPDIKCYNSPKKLVDEIREDVDAYFLDIEMPEINGIELAQFLRDRCRSEVIFVSAHSERVWISMKVKPLAFVRKLYLHEDVETAVERLLEETARKKLCIVLYDGKKAVTVRLNQVLYFSSERDYVIIHYADGAERALRQKLDVVEDNVRKYHFIRVHSRYLINLKAVDTIDVFSGVKRDKKIFLKNKTEIPVSSKYCVSVENELFKWFRGMDT